MKTDPLREARMDVFVYANDIIQLRFIFTRRFGGFGDSASSWTIPSILASFTMRMRVYVESYCC